MDPRNRPAPYVPTFLPEKSKFSETILPILSSILTELCKANDRCQSDPKITKFHALAVPPISVATYLQRIAQYSDASDTCYILALVYLDRIQARPEFLVTSLNIHRLLITSVMVAAKFFDDTYYNNAYYARVGGIAKQEMNALELEFLFMIGFSLSVSSAEFQQYDNELRAHYARRQAPALSRPIANSCVFPQQQQQQQTPQIQSSHVHIQQQQQQQPLSAGRNYASAPISYGVPVQQHPVYAPSRNFSYPSHPHQFSDSNVELSFYSNNNAMEVEAAERPVSIPQPSNAIVIRGPQNSRQQQVHSTPTCSPPSSDFVESVTSSRWVMIQ